MPRLLVGEAQLRAILDAIPSRVALYDRDRRHCYVNREYAAFVGREPHEVVGLTLPEVMGRETYARLEPYYRQLRPHSAKALGGEPSRWEGWLPYSAQGEPCFVQRLYHYFGWLSVALMVAVLAGNAGSGPGDQAA